MSNMIGIEIAKRAIMAGGAFDTSIDSAMDAVVKTELGGRSQADTEAALTKKEGTAAAGIWFQAPSTIIGMPVTRPRHPAPIPDLTRVGSRLWAAIMICPVVVHRCRPADGHVRTVDGRAALATAWRGQPSRGTRPRLAGTKVACVMGRVLCWVAESENGDPDTWSRRAVRGERRADLKMM